MIHVIVAVHIARRASKLFSVVVEWGFGAVCALRTESSVSWLVVHEEQTKSEEVVVSECLDQLEREST